MSSAELAHPVLTLHVLCVNSAADAKQSLEIA